MVASQLVFFTGQLHTDGRPLLESFDGLSVYVGVGKLANVESCCYAVSTSMMKVNGIFEIDGTILTTDQMVLLFVDQNPEDEESVQSLIHISYQGEIYHIDEYYPIGDIWSKTILESNLYGHDKDGNRQIKYYLLINPQFHEEIMELAIYLKFIKVFHESRSILFGKTKLGEAWNFFTAKVRQYLIELDPRYDDLKVKAWMRLPQDVRYFYDERIPNLAYMLDIPGLREAVRGQFSNPGVLNIVPTGINHASVSTEHELDEHVLMMISILDKIAETNPYPDFKLEELLEQHRKDIESPKQ